MDLIAADDDDFNNVYSSSQELEQELDMEGYQRPLSPLLRYSKKLEVNFHQDTEAALDLTLDAPLSPLLDNNGQISNDYDADEYQEDYNSGFMDSDVYQQDYSFEQNSFGHDNAHSQQDGGNDQSTILIASSPSVSLSLGGALSQQNNSVLNNSGLASPTDFSTINHSAEPDHSQPDRSQPDRSQPDRSQPESSPSFSSPPVKLPSPLDFAKLGYHGAIANHPTPSPPSSPPEPPLSAEPIGERDLPSESRWATVTTPKRTGKTRRINFGDEVSNSRGYGSDIGSQQHGALDDDDDDDTGEVDPPLPRIPSRPKSAFNDTMVDKYMLATNGEQSPALSISQPPLQQQHRPKANPLHGLPLLKQFSTPAAGTSQQHAEAAVTSRATRNLSTPVSLTRSTRTTTASQRPSIAVTGAEAVTLDDIDGDNGGISPVISDEEGVLESTNALSQRFNMSISPDIISRSIAAATEHEFRRRGGRLKKNVEAANAVEAEATAAAIAAAIAAGEATSLGRLRVTERYVTVADAAPMDDPEGPRTQQSQPGTPRSQPGTPRSHPGTPRSQPGTPRSEPPGTRTRKKKKGLITLRAEAHAATTARVVANIKAQRVRPDYENMSLARLRVVAMTFGLRAASKRVVVDQLIAIWDKLNPNPGEGGEQDGNGDDGNVAHAGGSGTVATTVAGSGADHIDDGSDVRDRAAIREPIAFEDDDQDMVHDFDPDQALDNNPFQENQDPNQYYFNPWEDDDDILDSRANSPTGSVSTIGGADREAARKVDSPPQPVFELDSDDDDMEVRVARRGPKPRSARRNAKKARIQDSRLSCLDKEEVILSDTEPEDGGTAAGALEDDDDDDEDHPCTPSDLEILSDDPTTHARSDGIHRLSDDDDDEGENDAEDSGNRSGQDDDEGEGEEEEDTSSSSSTAVSQESLDRQLAEFLSSTPHLRQQYLTYKVKKMLIWYSFDVFLGHVLTSSLYLFIALRSREAMGGMSRGQYCLQTGADSTILGSTRNYLFYPSSFKFEQLEKETCWKRRRWWSRQQAKETAFYKMNK
jgi:hypothetical protein